MPAKDSEIRRFLLKYAKKQKLRIKEYLSQDGCFFCHIENDDHSSTAVSREGFDNALVMAFLSFENPSYDFLD